MCLVSQTGVKVYFIFLGSTAGSRHPRYFLPHKIFSQGLGVWLGGRGLASHTGSPGFLCQHCQTERNTFSAVASTLSSCPFSQRPDVHTCCSRPYNQPSLNLGQAGIWGTFFEIQTSAQFSCPKENHFNVPHPNEITSYKTKKCSESVILVMPVR